MSLAADLELVIRRAIGPLPASSYEFNTEPDPEAPARGTMISLRPRSVDSCPLKISVTTDAPDVVLQVGEASRLELYEAWRSRTLDAESLVGECELIVGAVVAGTVSETVWKQGEYVVRAEVMIETPGGLLKASRYDLGLRPWPRPVKSHKQFRPYADPLSSSNRDAS